MRVDFSRATATSSSSDVLPEGEYRAVIERVLDTTTHAGDPMWKIRFRVDDGIHTNAVFTNQTFSEKALPRFRALLDAVGIDTTSQLVEVEPQDLEGRECVIVVEAEDYVDRDGQQRVGNSIPFDGFKPLDDAPRARPEDSVETGLECADDDLPF